MRNALVGVAWLFVAAGCGSRVCTPGQSVACTGPAGCAGGQVCSADGTSYSACDCGTGGGTGGGTSATTDGGTGGGTGGGSAAPTQGAIRLQWELRQQQAVITCGAASATRLSVLLTPSAGGSAIEFLPDCLSASGSGSGEFSDIPFGSYSLAVAALDASNLAVGQATTQPVTFDATACTALINGDCARDVMVSVVVP